MDPDEPDPSRPDCETDADGRIWITIGSAERLRHCNIPGEAILSFSYEVERQQPLRARKRKEHRKVEPVPEPVVPEPHKDAIVAQVSDDAAVSPAQVAASLEAVVEQPAAPTFDPMAVAQANPMLALALAVLAVVGGGAGFKLWTKMSEQKHEQKLKEMELQSQAQGLGGAQPPPCQAKQAETDAKLAALEGRVAKAERTSLAMGDDFDPEDIQKRIIMLERTMKRIGVKPSAAGGSK